MSETPEDSQQSALAGVKNNIRRLENFLKEKKQSDLRSTLYEWLYLTGLSFRKSNQYMLAIEAAGRIEFYENDRQKWWRWRENIGEYAERRQLEKAKEEFRKLM